MNQRFTKINIKGEILPDDASGWSIVQDNKTNLWWQRKTVEPMNWDEAKAYCENFNNLGVNGLGELKGWRLPTQDELLTLIDNQFSPSINMLLFPGTAKSCYWSSTENTFFPQNQSARFVSFADGFNDGCLKWNNLYVRAVCGGKS